MANDIFVDWHALEGKERMQLALNATGPFFVTGEDGIQLSAINSAAGVTLTLSGRFMQLNGEITPFAHTLTPATDRSVSSATRQLGNGWILNFNVIATAGTPRIGQCWTRVNVLRGDGGATTLLGTLASGYVTAVQSIAFPGSPLRGTLDGPGVVRAVVGSMPAAGADFIVTVPTGARWRLVDVWGIFTTSAAVANRFVQLIIDDGANVMFQSDPQTVQAASLQYRYVGSNGLTRSGNAGVVNMWNCPNDLLLIAGARIQSTTNSIDAADQWASPIVTVEEWIAGA